MVDWVALSDKEVAPGTDAIKQNVIVAKQEFDNRVTAWLSRVNKGWSYKNLPSLCPILTGVVALLAEALALPPLVLPV